MASWQAKAKCYPEMAEDFFPFGDERQVEVREQYEYLRRFCRPCPVREMCLQWAIEQNYDEGMFGGTTPKERRRMRSALQRQVKTAA